MKINRVYVKSLFGVFNHDIPLNKNNGITIIIGENGLGKTVILESINALFGKNYTFFGSLDFEYFNIYFDNKEIWQITKKSSKFGFSLFIGRDSLVKPVKKIKAYKIFNEDRVSRKKNINEEKKYSS